MVVRTYNMSTTQTPMQTIYAVSIEDPSVGGVEWRYSKDERDALLRDGIPGYTTEQLAPFDFQIAADATHEQITDLADELMWEGEFLNNQKD